MDTQGRIREALAHSYRVEELLGEGGMALVFLAEDLKHHRQVAIKVLRPEISAALGKERFLREIEIAAGLNHPNILALHDSGEADGLLYFVMPFLEGESLRTRLDREGGLSVEEAIRISIEVGDALDYAHNAGLVHRDVKPENILFQANHALVCDFGIAQATSDATQRLTQTGFSVGTFPYMSPEQLTGEQSADRSSDVYALGCLLHEMISGKVPFEAATPQASLTKKLTGSVMDLSKLRPDVPPTLQEVVQQALAADVHGRFRTASALLEALKTATTVAAIEKDAARRRNRRYLRTAGGAVGVTVLGILAFWISGMLGGPTMERIAVLPFLSRPADSVEVALLQGLHRDLVQELSRAGLRVIHSTAVARYADGDRTPREIAEELQVDGVVLVEASIGPDLVEMGVELVDGWTQESVWTQDYQRPMRDVFRLFGDLARGLAVNTGLELAPEAMAQLAEAREVDPQVYGLLLRARFHWQDLTREGLATALDYYEAALGVDSLSAEAWYGISEVWLGMAHQGYVSAEDAKRHADPAIARAAEIDPDLSSLQAQRASRLAVVDWEWVAAEEAFVRALAADPLDSQTRGFYSHYLLFVGREEEALEEGIRAATLDPFNTFIQGGYAMLLNFLGRYDEAEEVLLRAMERDPGSPMVLSPLRTTYHLTGREEEALRMFEASYASEEDMEAAEVLLAGYRSGGYRNALRTVADLFVERSETAFVTPWQIATLYARAGATGPTLDYLERAYDARDQNVPYISIDPIFDFIRDEPRFQVLVEGLGFPR